MVYAQIWTVNYYFIFSLSMKQLPGAAKRKRRKDGQKLVDSQRGSIHKFLKRNTVTPKNPDDLALVVYVVEESNVNLEDETHTQENV